MKRCYVISIFTLMMSLAAVTVMAVGPYTDNGDGTVTDTGTGLVWQQSDEPRSDNWESALAYCEGLNLGGYTDWRLPNVQELMSILSYDEFNPSIDTSVFDSTSSLYWSATTYEESTDYAWSVDFYSGGTTWQGKIYSFCTRCVRTAFCHSYDLVISMAGNGSGTVTSSPDGIYCSGDCSESYDEGTVVTLNATPASGSTFDGWGGDTDCADGSVIMNADKNCIATFNEEEPQSPPGKADLIYPTGYIALGTGLAFQWSAVPEADEYYLFVKQRNSEFLYERWYSASEAGCGSGTGVCSVMPDIDLNTGLYFWYVQTRNEAGTGPKSFKLFFAGY